MSILISSSETTKKRLDKIVATLRDSPFEEHSIDKLAREAGISKYHFHRLFLIFFGVNLYEFVIALRLRAAAQKLKYGQAAITEIAFECGYSSSQNFSKAFKNVFDQTPSDFRTCPNVKNFQKLSQKVKLVENLAVSNFKQKIEVVQFTETKIAGLRHLGKPNHLYSTINRFIEWRHKNRLSPHNFATFNIFHNPLSEDEYDFEVGCNFDSGTILDKGFGISTIPESKCASTIYVGSPDDIALPATELYKWVLDNGYEIADFPLFCRRISFPPFVEEDMSETVIYLPIK